MLNKRYFLQLRVCSGPNGGFIVPTIRPTEFQAPWAFIRTNPCANPIALCPSLVARSESPNVEDAQLAGALVVVQLKRKSLEFRDRLSSVSTCELLDMCGFVNKLQPVQYRRCSRDSGQGAQ
jgi:hypothetical protein